MAPKTPKHMKAAEAKAAELLADGTIIDIRLSELTPLINKSNVVLNQFDEGAFDPLKHNKYVRRVKSPQETTKVDN